MLFMIGAGESTVEVGWIGVNFRPEKDVGEILKEKKYALSLTFSSDK